MKYVLAFLLCILPVQMFTQNIWMEVPFFSNKETVQQILLSTKSPFITGSDEIVITPCSYIEVFYHFNYQDELIEIEFVQDYTSMRQAESDYEGMIKIFNRDPRYLPVDEEAEVDYEDYFTYTTSFITLAPQNDQDLNVITVIILRQISRRLFILTIRKSVIE